MSGSRRASAEEGRKYLEAMKLQPLLEDLLLELVQKRPSDLFGHISEWALSRRDPKFSSSSVVTPSRSSAAFSPSGTMSAPGSVDRDGSGQFNRCCSAIVIGRQTSKAELLELVGDASADVASKALQLHRQHVLSGAEKIFCGDDGDRRVRVSAHERNLQSVVLLSVEQELVTLPLIRAANLCTMVVLVVDDDGDAGSDDHASWEVCLRQLLMCSGVGISRALVVRKPSLDQVRRRRVLSTIRSTLNACGFDSSATPIVDLGPGCRSDVVAAIQHSAPRKRHFAKRVSKHVRCTLQACKLAVHVGKTYRAFSDGTAFSCAVQSCANTVSPSTTDGLRVGDSGELLLDVLQVAATLAEAAPLCLFVDGSVFAVGMITSLPQEAD